MRTSILSNNAAEVQSINVANKVRKVRSYKPGYKAVHKAGYKPGQKAKYKPGNYTAVAKEQCTYEGVPLKKLGLGIAGDSKPCTNPKCVNGVVYEAKTITEKCTVCTGDGLIPRVFPCKWCGGQGGDCKACKGTGIFIHPTLKKKCTCNHGKVEVFKQVPIVCSTCHGTGAVRNHNPVIPWHIGKQLKQMVSRV